MSLVVGHQQHDGLGTWLSNQPQHAVAGGDQDAANSGTTAAAVENEVDVFRSTSAHAASSSDNTQSTNAIGAVQDSHVMDLGNQGDGDGQGEPSVRDIQRALKKNFVNTGVIDDVTARLRRQFVCELQRSGLGVPGARQATASYRSRTGISLKERVLHSLVVDHLASNGLLQTLAVFLPESGLGNATAAAAAAASSSKASTVPSRNTDSSSGGPPTGTAATGEVASEGPGRLLAPSALSREDVLQGLPIASESVLFRRVMGRAAGGDRSPGGAAVVEERGGGVGCSGGARQVSGLLEALVGEVAARSCAVAVDSNTQTEETGRSHQENLDSRLGKVRDNWLRRSADERQAPARDVAERMLAYQRECESRATVQVKAEVDSFRQRDITALRLQMAANQRREVDAMRKELQAQYDVRVCRLEELERERDRRHAERLREVEAKQFEARQQLLREMDQLRMREQEARRAAEIEARGIRAEELRLRDLVVSLDGRAEELRRREREGARGREEALEAARHEARQAVEVQEENVAREREFLRQEMEAVRAERQSCKEQLRQHTETARALQEARSEVLTQDARARIAEAEAERLEEEAAVYKEAYETRRHVVMDSDNRVSARPGREELEGRVRSLEAALEEDADRHRRALREAVGTRDELAAEAQTLRAREGKWAQEATELSRALSEAELQRDRAEHQAEEEACERAALDIQVNELRALLRRSRDAIEAIRLCETEADASTGRTTVAASATTTTAPAGVAATNPDSCTLATATQGGVMPGNTLRPAASARVSTACLPRDRQAWSAAAPFHTSGDSIVFWEDGGLSPYARGQAWAEPRSGDLVPIVRRQQPGFPSRSLAGVVAMDSKKLRVTRAGTAATAAGRGSGYWSEGHVVRSTVAVERPSSTGGSGVFSVFGGAAVARREDPWDTEVALRDGVLWKRGSGVGAARDRQRSKHRGGGDSPSESDGQNEDSSDEGSSDGERGRYKRSSSMKASRAENRRARRRAKSKERHAAAVTKRAEMAERLLAEERRAMTRELEAERARFREKEEERHRERQEDRARREKEEVEAMRRRLADEEARAAAATTAATAAAAERQRRTLREEVDRQERERREKQEQLVTAEKRLGQNRSRLRKDREIPTGDVGEGLRVLTTTTTTDVTSAVHPVADENSEGLRVKEKDFVRCDRNDDGPSHRKSEQKSPRGGPFPVPALLREVAPVPGAPVSAVEQAPDSSVPSVCFADPSAATDSVIVPPTASTTHSPAIKSATVPRSAVASVVDPSALHAAVASVSATDASMNERNDDGVCGPAAADLPLTGNDSAKTSTSTAAPAAVTFNAAEETKEGKSGDSVGLPGVEEVIKEREGGLLGSSAPGTSVERKNSSGDGGSDAMGNVISGQTAVLEAPEETQRAQADREVREYREKIRERRQQQQQQQHKATSIARYASSSSPADSDHDFETEHSALRAGKPSARGDSDGEDLAKAEMESDSGAASGVGGGEGSGLSVGRSVNSVSGGSDSDWF